MQSVIQQSPSTCVCSAQLKRGGHFCQGPHTSQNDCQFGSTNLGVNKGFLGEGVLLRIGRRFLMNRKGTLRQQEHVLRLRSK